MVDAVCSHQASVNYINFRFKGGGTGLETRVRRILFLTRVLDSLGFYVNAKQDLLNATLKGLPSEELEGRLDMLGRLLGCSRLLDMAMGSPGAVEWFADAFLQGNYRFEPERSPALE
jgi:pyruvate,water dikinase